LLIFYRFLKDEKCPLVENANLQKNTKSTKPQPGAAIKISCIYEKVMVRIENMMIIRM